MSEHPSKNVGNSNPLGDHVEHFLAKLEGQHYARGTLGNYRRCLRALANHMREKRIKTASLSEADAHRLATDCSVSRGQQAIFTIKQFIRYLVGVGAVPAPEASR